MACCPAHDDKNPSLAVDDSASGLLVKCFAGCDQGAVIDALKARGLWPGNGDTYTSSSKPRTGQNWRPVVPVPADAPPPPAAHETRGKPAMTWRYLSTDGGLLQWVYRFNKENGGKDVLPLTFCTDGNRHEWRWQALPEPRPLYGLELLGDGRHVVVVEGEKATDAARRLLGDRLPVVTWPGGCNAVAKADWSPLAAKSVAIWPDADESGTKAALAVADCLAKIGCIVKIVEPPDDVVSGWDLADADAEGWTGEQVREKFKAALPADKFKANQCQGQTDEKTASVEISGEVWPEPLTLVAETKPESYPTDALPKEIGEAVEEVRKFVQAPVAMVAASALGALSTAAQSLVDVKRSERLSGPASLFMLSLAESGERKTTIDGFFTEVVREYQRDEVELAKPVLVQYRAEHAAWEARRAGIIEAIKAASKAGKLTGPLETDLQAIERLKPSPPRVPELLRGDDTPEALAYDLANRWPAGAVISSEAGVVFGSAGMGSERVLRNLALLNVLWDGGELPVKRKGSDHFTVRGARLTLSLQVQEAALLEFFRQTGQLARGTGFLARFLVACPVSTQGHRPFTEAPATWPHLSRFNSRLLALLRTPAPINPDGTLSPVLLTFSPAAKAAWIEYHDQVEAMLRTGGELSNIKDIASKSADNAARLAALFHAFQHGPSGEISVDDFTNASRIAAWHLNEALRFFGGLSLPVEQSAAARLESWLLDYFKQHGAGPVSRRTIQRLGPYGLRDSHALTAAITELEELGRARLLIDGRRKDIALNPAILGV
jgi:putative DNA primase/helicase